jgi:hypothetical protein
MQEIYDAIKHLADGEVYAVVAASNAQYPSIVYTPIEQAHVIALDGPSPLKRSRVQIDTYARSLQVCQQLQDAVLLAVLARVESVADVRMGLTEFDNSSRVYRVSVDITYYR